MNPEWSRGDGMSASLDQHSDINRQIISHTVCGQQDVNRQSVTQSNCPSSYTFHRNNCPDNLSNRNQNRSAFRIENKLSKIMWRKRWDWNWWWCWNGFSFAHKFLFLLTKKERNIHEKNDEVQTFNFHTSLKFLFKCSRYTFQ
jgi:hypothetical protein